jgi:F-type H+-transporting ATPase subunit delta
MKNLTISRRYAKALMLISREDGKTDQYQSELQSVIELFDAQQEFESALINPLYNKNERRKVLTAVLAATQLSGIMKSFLVLLFDKGRIGFLRDIASFYRDLADELKGVVKARVISASALPAGAINKIKKALSKKFGKNIVLNVEKDPSLIGGIVTKIGDLVLDGSVKTQLMNLKETLKKGESV